MFPHTPLAIFITAIVLVASPLLPAFRRSPLWDYVAPANSITFAHALARTFWTNKEVPPETPYSYYGVNNFAPTDQINKAAEKILGPLVPYTRAQKLSVLVFRRQQAEDELAKAYKYYEILTNPYLRCEYHRLLGLPDWYGVPDVTICQSERAITQLQEVTRVFYKAQWGEERYVTILPISEAAKKIPNLEAILNEAKDKTMVGKEAVLVTIGELTGNFYEIGKTLLQLGDHGVEYVKDLPGYTLRKFGAGMYHVSQAPETAKEYGGAAWEYGKEFGGNVVSTLPTVARRTPGYFGLASGLVYHGLLSVLEAFNDDLDETLFMPPPEPANFFQVPPRSQLRRKSGHPATLETPEGHTITVSYKKTPSETSEAGAKDKATSEQPTAEEPVTTKTPKAKSKDAPAPAPAPADQIPKTFEPSRKESKQKQRMERDVYLGVVDRILADIQSLAILPSSLLSKKSYSPDEEVSSPDTETTTPPSSKKTKPKKQPKQPKQPTKKQKEAPPPNPKSESPAYHRGKWDAETFKFKAETSSSPRTYGDNPFIDLFYALGDYAEAWGNIFLATSYYSVHSIYNIPIQGYNYIHNLFFGNGDAIPLLELTQIPPIPPFPTFDFEKIVDIPSLKIKRLPRRIPKLSSILKNYLPSLPKIKIQKSPTVFTKLSSLLLKLLVAIFPSLRKHSKNNTTQKILKSGMNKQFLSLRNLPRMILDWITSFFKGVGGGTGRYWNWSGGGRSSTTTTTSAVLGTTGIFTVGTLSSTTTKSGTGLARRVPKLKVL